MIEVKICVPRLVVNSRSFDELDEKLTYQVIFCQNGKVTRQFITDWIGVRSHHENFFCESI